MKKMLIILFAAGIYSCGNNPSATGQATTESVADKAADSITNKQDTLNALWINDFRDFRNAVYQDDVNKLKIYFKFPVLNPYNEIWSVVLADSTDIFGEVGSDTLHPFTENDFVKYHKKLFTKEFVSGILKIKSDELLKRKESSTDILDSDSTTNYSMSATVDTTDNTLRLIILFNTGYKDENGKFEKEGESSINYNFLIQSDGHLLFKEIRIAG